MLDPHQPLSRRSKIVRWVGILLLMKRAFIALKTEKERLNPLYHEQSELCVFLLDMYDTSDKCELNIKFCLAVSV